MSDVRLKAEARRAKLLARENKTVSAFVGEVLIKFDY
jgi:hypothetical protein